MSECIEPSAGTKKRGRYSALAVAESWPLGEIRL